MIIENRTFDSLRLGDTAELRKVCTTDDLFVFAAATGNHNPMHVPDQDIDGDGRADTTASGMFLAAMISAVLGNVLPGPGTFYRAQALQFLGHAGAGDELLARVTVTGLGPDAVVTLSTQVIRLRDGVEIVRGTAQVDAPLLPIRFDDRDLPGLIVQTHTQFDAILKRAQALPALRTAVVWPDDAQALQGALLAARHGLIVPVLLGNADRFRALAAEMGADLSPFGVVGGGLLRSGLMGADFSEADLSGADLSGADLSGADLSGVEIVEAASDHDAAQMAVTLARAGKVQAIMKGNLHTDNLLRPMLDRDTGLRVGRRFTHVFVVDVPGLLHPLLVSDAAINIAPDLMTKVDIVQNAIDLAHSLGIACPRVAVLSAVETVTPDMPSSMEAAALAKMAERGQITGGLVDGPLAMDNAVDLAAARLKGIHGAVAGRAEVLIVPNIESGNILVKLLTHLAHAEAAGLVMGALVPVILTSRADGPLARLASAALAVLHAGRRLE